MQHTSLFIGVHQAWLFNASYFPSCREPRGDKNACFFGQMAMRGQVAKECVCMTTACVRVCVKGDGAYEYRVHTNARKRTPSPQVPSLSSTVALPCLSTGGSL